MKKTDLCLVAVILVIAAISLFIGNAIKEDGKNIIVSVNGKVYAKYLLSENGCYELKGYDGGYNTLMIEDGVAYLTDADCPDKLCVKQGKISKIGESIICLPHKIVVEITGEGERLTIDAVTQ